MYPKGKKPAPAANAKPKVNLANMTSNAQAVIVTKTLADLLIPATPKLFLNSTQ